MQAQYLAQHNNIAGLKVVPAICCDNAAHVLCDALNHDLFGFLACGNNIRSRRFNKNHKPSRSSTSNDGPRSTKTWANTPRTPAQMNWMPFVRQNSLTAMQSASGESVRMTTL